MKWRESALKLSDSLLVDQDGGAVQDVGLSYKADGVGVNTVHCNGVGVNTAHCNGVGVNAVHCNGVGVNTVHCNGVGVNSASSEVSLSVSHTGTAPASSLPPLGLGIAGRYSALLWGWG